MNFLYTGRGGYHWLDFTPQILDPPISVKFKLNDTENKIVKNSIGISVF